MAINGPYRHNFCVESLTFLNPTKLVMIIANDLKTREIACLKEILADKTEDIITMRNQNRCNALCLLTTLHL